MLCLSDLTGKEIQLTCRDDLGAHNKVVHIVRNLHELVLLLSVFLLPHLEAVSYVLGEEVWLESVDHLYKSLHWNECIH